MSDAAKKMMIRMALDYVVSGLEKLAKLLRDMDEKDVADRVTDIKGQLVETLKKRDDNV